MSVERQDTGGGDAVEQFAETAVLCIAGALVLPLVLGQYGAPTLAKFPVMWRRKGLTWMAIWLGMVGACIACLWLLWTFWLPPTLRWLGHQPLEHMDRLTVLVPTLWLCLIPLGLAAAWVRGSEIADQLHRGERASASAEPIRRAITRAALQDARAIARHMPTANREGVPAAVVIEGDRRPSATRWVERRTTPGSDEVRRRRNRWGRSSYLTITTKATRIVVIGGSGSGKSTLIRNIADRYLQLGHRVLFLDGKGDSGDQRRLIEQAMARGIPDSAIRLWPEQPYDAWRGDPAMRETKLHSLLPQPAGDAAYHHDRDMTAIRTILDSKPYPESSRELLARLRDPRPWVEDIEVWRFMTGGRGGQRQHQVTYDRVVTAIRGCQALIDPAPGSWSLDDPDWQLAVCSISSNDEVRATLMILADLAEYRRRQDPSITRPLVVVLDEAQVVLDQPLKTRLPQMFEWFRSANITLLIASQSVIGLGEDGPRILRSGASLLVGRGLDPEEVVGLAGTIRGGEGTIQSDETMSSSREQHQYLIDPMHMRWAAPGQFAFIQEGSAARWVVFPNE